MQGSADSEQCLVMLELTRGFAAEVCSPKCRHPSLRRYCRYNATKADVTKTSVRGEIAAARSKQNVASVIEPRPAAQHTVLLLLRVIPILAPLPDITSHVVQAKLVGLKASHRIRALSHVIASSFRRRPLCSPRINIDFAAFLFRRIPGLRSQSHRYTPLLVGR
jgi:hypothetical protein